MTFNTKVMLGIVISLTLCYGALIGSILLDTLWADLCIPFLLILAVWIASCEP